jgi:phosphodiesterase/alkaline phosphatase D-like protein
MTRSDSRRDFLRTAAALATLPLLPACATEPGTTATAKAPLAVTFDALAVVQDDKGFPLAVQAGSMHADRGIFWSFVQGAPAATLRVWQAAKTPGQVLIAHESVVQAVDGYLKTPVLDLEPGTLYHYAFFLGSAGAFTARSALGQVRSAFAPDVVAPLTIGMTSCTRGNFAPFQALAITAGQGIDVFCHLGDMIYGDSAHTREDYRGKWREVLTDPGYRALLPTVATLQCWDDHEITNDDQRYQVPPERRTAAVESFFEATPVPRLGGDRFWDRYRWGKSVEFFVLDCRGERVPESRLTDDPIYMSPEQFDWLQKGLQDSPCHFKVVLNSVPITLFPNLWVGVPDRWQGFTKRRDQLLDHITSHAIRNVWWLSGDFHVGVVSRLETSGPRSRMFEILGGPGGNENPVAKGLLLDPDLKAEQAPPEQFLYTGTEVSATTLVFDPVADTVRVRFLHGTTGAVLYDQVLHQDA